MSRYYKFYNRYSAIIEILNEKQNRQQQQVRIKILKITKKKQPSTTELKSACIYNI